jgi:hypothetical protein
MSTTFKYDIDRPLTLRKSTGSLSAGTRVDFVQVNNDGSIKVAWKDQVLDMEQSDLVVLRTRRLQLPGAELRKKMALVLNTA